MIPYRIELPLNYEEIRTTGNSVSRTIESRTKVPKPTDIEKVLGKEALDAYYLMHALFYSIENGRQRGILDYARRDRIAIQLHSWDSAFKNLYRAKDRNLPSNYLLTPREIKGDLVHDVGEEFGQTVLGALVVNDLIGYLLGESTGRDAQLLTNFDAIISDSLEERIGTRVADMHAQEITSGIVYNVLGESANRVRVTERMIQFYYSKVLAALQNFKEHAKGFNDKDLPYNERMALLGKISKLEDRTRKWWRERELRAESARPFISGRYERLMDLIRGSNYADVDTRLSMEGDPMFLLIFNATIYKDFVKDIAANVQMGAKSASQNGSPTGDSYLSPMIEKLTEATQTAANLDPQLPRAMSIFRKSNISLPTAIDLVGTLKQIGVDQQRLVLAGDYLFRNLVAIVTSRKEEAERNYRNIDNNWKLAFRKYEAMEEILKDLEGKVRAMSGQSWVTAIGDFVKGQIGTVGRLAREARSYIW